MFPAIGYSMCTADSRRPNSPADRRRLQTTASLDSQFANPQSTDHNSRAIEIDFDSLNHGPDSLGDLPNERVTLHAVSLPAGSADCRTERALSCLTELARKKNARAVIARLDAMPTAPAPSEGRAASRPRAWKAEAADLSRQVEFVQSRLGEIPFYLESKIEGNWFKPRSTDKCVLRKVLAGTGCGWFLDVTALYVAAMNSAQDACDFIEEVLPSADHVELSLTGVRFDEKAERWLASDSHPIPEAVFELYAFVLEVAFDKVDAVFVRRNRANDDAEIQTVREIAEGVSAIV
jgi:uncharacterized protein (UPF0276 family)